MEKTSVNVVERPGGPISLSSHLTREVLSLILEEELRPGDRLPSVKELSERFSGGDADHAGGAAAAADGRQSRHPPRVGNLRQSRPSRD